ncbi:MAG TPA: hypothetical protein VFZ65_07610 [Planctomycetota bacterium]|nr:hypothetical protein [Planctomycetota bacterium]
MKFPLRSLSLALAVLAASCASMNTKADLAENELLYVDVPFLTKAPGDRALFVAPLVDVRDRQVLPTDERGFPIAYGGDDFWDRPVVDMVGDVLVRQLRGSGLFAAVVDQATPDVLVLKPTLVSFTTGQTEAISGSRSFAEVNLQLQVLGPAGADGQRAVLFEQSCKNRQVSELELNPVSPFRLVGHALQMSMSKALSSLDGSNVGRRNVPLAAPEASEAAAARPPQ